MVSCKEEKEVIDLIIVKRILYCVCQSCIYASEWTSAVTCLAWRADWSVLGLIFNLIVWLSLPLKWREGYCPCIPCPVVSKACTGA